MLAAFLAAAVLAADRHPVPVPLVSLLASAHSALTGVIGHGWVWPATAAIVVAVLRGHLRATAVAVAAVLLFAANDRFDEVFAAELLYPAAVIGIAAGYRSLRRWQASVESRIEVRAREIAAEVVSARPPTG